MSKARKLEPPMPATNNVHKHGLARMPMSRKKRVFTKFNACKCCPMTPITEEELCLVPFTNIIIDANTIANIYLYGIII